MNRLKNTLTATVVCAAFVTASFSSCTENGREENFDNDEIEVIEEPATADIVTVDYNVCLLGVTETDEFTSSLISRFDKTVSEPKSAKLLVVDGSSFDTYSDEVLAAYKLGNLITIVRPDMKRLNEWVEENGIIFTYFPDEDVPLCSFNRVGKFHLIENRLLEDEDVPLAQMDFSLNAYSRWANRTLKPVMMGGGVNPRSNEIKQRYVPQTVTRTVIAEIKDGILAYGSSSKPAVLSKSAAIDVTYTVYPVHCYAGSQSAGDYYFVEMEVSADNAAMYNGLWNYMRGDLTAHLCGFYMSGLELTSSLAKVLPGGAYADYTACVFPSDASPYPVSTQDASAYESGINWTFSGEIGGGIPSHNNMPILAEGEWLWKAAASHSLENVALSNTSVSPSVSVEAVVKHLPAVSGQECLLDIPAVAVDNLTLYASWIWYLPEVGDGASDEFSIVTALRPRYEGYSWFKGATDFSTVSFVPDEILSFNFRLYPPKREK